MINHPVTFHRDFRNDFPLQENQPNPGIWEQCQRVALATIPLLSLHSSFRGPLSLGMSSVRSVTHFSQTLENIQQGNIGESSFHFLNASLATTAAGLYFFNPVLGYLSSSISDLTINSRQLLENPNLETLGFLLLDILFIASFCYGEIEITVALMLLQITMDLALSAKHFSKGQYLEAVCEALLASGHMAQALPQMKVLEWKWKHNPTLTAELKQAEHGFVYLDIPDEYVYSLHGLCDDPRAELPPYFGKKSAGAHVSVMLGSEIAAKNGLTVSDIGKKFTFRIVQMNAVKPEGFKGVDKVYFLTLACPELNSVRTRHGFSPKIHDHDFHLTFGICRT